jgi:hypothetical protein
MAWFIVRDAFGEVLEATPCAESGLEQARRMARAVHAWQQRGDHARKLDELKFQMTSFDGNVRILSIEMHRPTFRRDAPLRGAREAKAPTLEPAAHLVEIRPTGR